MHGIAPLAALVDLMRLDVHDELVTTEQLARTFLVALHRRRPVVVAAATVHQIDDCKRGCHPCRGAEELAPIHSEPLGIDLGAIEHQLLDQPVLLGRSLEKLSVGANPEIDRRLRLAIALIPRLGHGNFPPPQWETE